MGGAAEMDVVESAVSKVVETDLEVAPAGGDEERVAGVGRDGGCDCGGCYSRSASEGLGLDTSLVGTDGDVGWANSLDEIDIDSVGGEAVGETYSRGFRHDVDLVKVVDKLDVVWNAGIDFEGPLPYSFCYFDWRHEEVDPILIGEGDSRVGSVVGDELEWLVGRNDTLADGKATYAAGSVAAK